MPIRGVHQFLHPPWLRNTEGRYPCGLPQAISTQPPRRWSGRERLGEADGQNLRRLTSRLTVNNTTIS